MVRSTTYFLFSVLPAEWEHLVTAIDAGLGSGPGIDFGRVIVGKGMRELFYDQKENVGK